MIEAKTAGVMPDIFYVSAEEMREIDALIAVAYFGYKWTRVTKRRKELRSPDFDIAVKVDGKSWQETGHQVPTLPRYTQDPAFVFPLMIEIARLSGGIYYNEEDRLGGKLWRVFGGEGNEQVIAYANTLPIAVGLIALKFKKIEKPELSCNEYSMIGHERRK